MLSFLRTELRTRVSYLTTLWPIPFVTHAAADTLATSRNIFRQMLALNLFSSTNVTLELLLAFLISIFILQRVENNAAVSSSVKRKLIIPLLSLHHPPGSRCLSSFNILSTSSVMCLCPSVYNCPNSDSKSWSVPLVLSCLFCRSQNVEIEASLETPYLVSVSLRRVSV